MADKYIQNKIIADILSFENGAEHYENLTAVRLDSSNYSLRIMSDYLPMIGELDGKLTLVSEEGDKVYNGVKGFYRHAHNNFEFILKERKNA